MRRASILACLTGAGTAPELMAEALYALDAVAHLHCFAIEQTHAWFGGAAHARWGQTVPACTREAVIGADAVLVAGAEEPSLDEVMAELDLRAHVTRVRFAQHGDVAFVTSIGENSSEWAVTRAFEIAERRRLRLVCIGDALWGDLVDAVGCYYEHVHVEHVSPREAMPFAAFDAGRFDVVSVAPAWAEALIDIAAAAAEHRVAAHALLAEHGPSLFVPSPDGGFALAGQGVANPSSMLLCTALALEYGLNQPAAAATLAGAVSSALATAPQSSGLLRSVSTTREFTRRVLAGFQLSNRNAEFWLEAT